MSIMSILDFDGMHGIRCNGNGHSTRQLAPRHLRRDKWSRPTWLTEVDQAHISGLTPSNGSLAGSGRYAAGFHWHANPADNLRDGLY